MKSAYWLIGVIILVAVYIFSSGGFNINTITGFVGWVLAGMGVLAFYGGARKSGVIAFVAGIVIVNIPTILGI